MMSDELSPLARLRMRIAQLISQVVLTEAGQHLDARRSEHDEFVEATSIHEALRGRADDIEYRLRQIRIVRERDPQ